MPFADEKLLVPSSCSFVRLQSAKKTMNWERGMVDEDLQPVVSWES
jgi:hypothetical protein